MAKNKSIERRIKSVTPDEFKALLHSKAIRPASLDDVYGTHHSRALYIHPNLKNYWAAVK